MCLAVSRCASKFISYFFLLGVVKEFATTLNNAAEILFCHLSVCKRGVGEIFLYQINFADHCSSF